MEVPGKRESIIPSLFTTLFSIVESAPERSLLMSFGNSRGHGSHLFRKSPQPREAQHNQSDSHADPKKYFESELRYRRAKDSYM